MIDDFILAAGVSRGTFYNYFRTISELLEATIAWMADDLTRAGETQVASIEDVVLRLATAMRLHLRWASLNRKWCAFMARIPNAATVGAVAQHHLVRDLIQGRKSAAFDFPSIDAALDLAVGVAHDGYFAAGGESGGAHCWSTRAKWGTDTPSATSSKTTSAGRPIRSVAGSAPISCITRQSPSCSAS